MPEEWNETKKEGVKEEEGKRVKFDEDILSIASWMNSLPLQVHRPFLEANMPLWLSSKESSKRFCTLSSVTDESAQYLTAYAKSLSAEWRMTDIRV